jgi:hypothetical protein
MNICCHIVLNIPSRGMLIFEGWIYYRAGTVCLAFVTMLNSSKCIVWTKKGSLGRGWSLLDGDGPRAEEL